MPRIPVWMEPVMHTHPTRKWKPNRDILVRKKFPDWVVRQEAEYLERLFRNSATESAKLVNFLTALEEARPKGPPYDRRGDYETYKRTFIAWTKYLHGLLAKNPEIRKRFLKYLTRRYLENRAGVQITFAGRHITNDITLFRILGQTGLKPSSFLEVGAGFESHGRDLPDMLMPVRESKEYFDKKGIEMKYTAVDIIPISRSDQKFYKRRGITALQWDYRERPLIQARRKVKQFSVIRMANVSRHQTRGEFQKTVKVLLRSLEPNGILIIKNDGDGLHDEAFYQKQKKRERWTLVQIHSKK